MPSQPHNSDSSVYVKTTVYVFRNILTWFYMQNLQKSYNFRAQILQTCCNLIYGLRNYSYAPEIIYLWKWQKKNDYLRKNKMNHQRTKPSFFEINRFSFFTHRSFFMTLMVEVDGVLLKTWLTHKNIPRGVSQRN